MANNVLSDGQVLEVASFNGIKVYQIKTDRFKTNSINVFFHDNLSRENASNNAMLPAVLRRGSVNFPTIQDISLYLEELYGATFDCGVTKKGENQIIQFYLDFICDKYASGETDLTKKAFDLLFEIITNPVTENGVFKREYVQQEAKNLKELIESRVNDKVQYGVDKCLEVMCENEPFGIFDYGTVEDIDTITENNLYEHYKYFLETLPVYVFISGDFNDDKTGYIIYKLKQINRREIKKIQPTNVEKHVSQVREVVERMNVNQAKLSVGFRTNIEPNSENYYKLMLYNSILGGGIHSKLFQNVREKNGMAYYVFSRLEKFKGLMVISAGIEISNKDKAYEVIVKQLEDMKNGNISDYEFESSIKSIETGIKSLKDSQLQIVDFNLSQIIAGAKDSPDDIIEKVKKVSRQDVIDIANCIEMDTVYFLTSM